MPDGYTAAPEQTVDVGIGATAHVGDIDYADVRRRGRQRARSRSRRRTTRTTRSTAPSSRSTPTSRRSAGRATRPTRTRSRTRSRSARPRGSGTCEITNVAPGKYWVVETVTPPHYETAADRPITVGLGDAPGVGDNVPVSFTDVRKDRVVVLVCSEGTDTLNSRDVTVNGVKKQSLTGGWDDRRPSRRRCVTSAAPATATSPASRTSTR